MKFTNVESAQFKGFKAKALLMLVMALLVAGCGVDNDDGDVVDTIALPTDDTAPLRLECENVGIYTESCVLDDPNNPYAGVIVSEDTKFELGADTPSATAAFYLWATALANGAGAPGENQFFVALNLQRLWAHRPSTLPLLHQLHVRRARLG